MKGRKYPPETLEDAEVQLLLRACNKGRTGTRNQALILVLYRAGLRVSEAIALLPKDVNLQTGEIRVLHGKGDKHRLEATDPEPGALVERWVLRRRRVLDPRVERSAPLFCTLKGGRLTPAYVRALLPRLARDAGVTKRVHAHGLRHTYAAQLGSD